MNTDTTTRRVLDEVDALADRMVESLAELVRVPSVNPKYPGQDYAAVVGGEGEASSLIADLYREAGGDVEVFAVEPGRDNAAARIRGANGGRSLALNGHIDVVPAGDGRDWSAEPFSGRIDDHHVWGRGAADMKAGVIAHAYAAIALRRAGVRLGGDLLLHTAVGEEMGDHTCGTTAILERGYRADAAIVCEPTSAGDQPAVVPVHPGMIWFSVTVTGRTAHVGMRGPTVHPTAEGQSLGVNAIDKGFYVYAALRQLEEEWAQTKRHPLFAPGYFALLPGVAVGSPKGILVPFFLADSMTLEYCTYHHPDEDPERVKDEIKTHIDRACSLDPWLRDHPPAVEWKLEWPPTQVPVDSPVTATLAKAYETAAAGTDFAEQPRLAGFQGVCDTTWLARQGVPAVTLGPGDLRRAHAANERVEIRELLLAARTYAVMALSWCGQAPEPVAQGRA